MVMATRSAKMVQLRDGVYANGAPRREDARHTRLRHIIYASVDSIETKELTSPCGITFAPGTLEIVEWNCRKAHKLCRRRVCQQGRCR
jgi:hypothetical protein